MIGHPKKIISIPKRVILIKQVKHHYGFIYDT